MRQPEREGDADLPACTRYARVSQRRLSARLRCLQAGRQLATRAARREARGQSRETPPVSRRADSSCKAGRAGALLVEHAFFSSVSKRLDDVPVREGGYISGAVDGLYVEVFALEARIGHGSRGRRRGQRSGVCRSAGIGRVSIHPVHEVVET